MTLFRGMETSELIEELTNVLDEQIRRAKEIRSLPSGTLLHHPGPDQWNALEIFEHLCLSSGIYVRGLERVFDRRADELRHNPRFHPGLLGNYLTRAMLPKADGTIRHRMRTLRMFDPPRNNGASLASIDRFIDLCERLQRLLVRARTTDLNRMKVTSSLGPIIRFKAGDALRFPVAHQQRHFLQLERVLVSAAHGDQRTTTSLAEPDPARTV